VTEPLDELRAVAEQTPDAPPAMASYLAAVRVRAYTLTNADVEALKDAGCSEDEIFEQTVAVAIGEGLRRLDAAREVLG
jgi:alkylhydroperoxidase family enzyme